MLALWVCPGARGRDEPDRVVLGNSGSDVLGGQCDPRQVNAASAAMLLGSPQEMERLRRAYSPRTVEDKRRDADCLIRRVIGVR